MEGIDALPGRVADRCAIRAFHESLGSVRGWHAGWITGYV
jgi:hypothetical protein